MTIMYVETWILKPDKLAEYKEYIKHLDEYLKTKTDIPKGVKPIRRFFQMYGGNWGGIVTMLEADSEEDLMKARRWLTADKEYWAKLYPEWAAIVVPGSDSASIWTSELS